MGKLFISTLLCGKITVEYIFFAHTSVSNGILYTDIVMRKVASCQKFQCMQRILAKQFCSNLIIEIYTRYVLIVLLLFIQKKQPKVIRSLSSNDANRVTLSKQHELQKLPVPKLQDTVSKWLTTTKPHLSSAEFEKTKGKQYIFLVQS